MTSLRQFNEILVKAGSWGTILFMAVIAVVIPYEVVGRYVFQSMSTWSGEVSTYSLAWASMLGGAVGLKKGYQVSLNFLVSAVPPTLARSIKVTACAFTLFFFGVMFYFGLYQTLYNARQFSPAMELVMSVPYAALPAGFFIMFFFTLEEFLSLLGLGAESETQ